MRWVEEEGEDGIDSDGVGSLAGGGAVPWWGIRAAIGTQFQLEQAEASAGRDLIASIELPKAEDEIMLQQGWHVSTSITLSRVSGSGEYGTLRRWKMEN